MAGESPVMELADAERDLSGALVRTGWIHDKADSS